MTAILDATGRWRWSLGPAAGSALAATIAWWLAAGITGEPRPVFASVTAIVALAPGVANPRLQILGFLSGVAIGLAVGEAARPVAASAPALAMGPVVLVAIVAAATFVRNPLSLIQAGATAALVLGSSTDEAGRAQFAQALVGGAVAITFSQLFFAPDPVPKLEEAVGRLAEAGAMVAGAPGAQRAELLDRVAAASSALETAISQAAGIRRWTVRGRLAAPRIQAAEDRWELPARRLSAAAALACLADGTAVERELRNALQAVWAEPDG